MRRLTRPWATFIELASSSPAVMARPSRALARKESWWRSLAVRLAWVVLTATMRMPPPAAVARRSWSLKAGFPGVWPSLEPS